VEGGRDEERVLERAVSEDEGPQVCRRARRGKACLLPGAEHDGRLVGHVSCISGDSTMWKRAWNGIAYLFLQILLRLWKERMAQESATGEVCELASGRGEGARESATARAPTTLL
jgi:hypothetical protein